MDSEITKELNSQFVFSQNNQVLIKLDVHNDEWFPINFQWIPVVNLRKNMK